MWESGQSYTSYISDYPASSIKHLVSRTRNETMIGTNDDAITGDVIAAFGASPDVQATEILVFTHVGRVRLQGIVATLEEKEMAEEIALLIKGVLGVVNNITVSANETISNLEIQRDVTRRLTDAGLTQVGARVEVGVAFLMGVIPSLAVKNQAMEVAAGVEGVRDVISELEIAAGEPVDDIKLGDDVAEAISDDPRLTVFDLSVQAEDGLILLNGEVDIEYQRDIAAAVAEAVPGAQHIDNRIRVVNM